jgi:hypothetical protein
MMSFSVSARGVWSNRHRTRLALDQSTFLVREDSR